MKKNIIIKLFGIKILEIIINHEGGIASNPIPYTVPVASSDRDVSKGYNGALRPDLKSVEIETGFSKAPVEEVKIKCVSCEGTTYESDIAVCHECGEYICSGCGSLDTTTNKKYCEKCWGDK